MFGRRVSSCARRNPSPTPVSLTGTGVQRLGLCVFRSITLSRSHRCSQRWVIHVKEFDDKTRGIPRSPCRAFQEVPIGTE